MLSTRARSYAGVLVLVLGTAFASPLSATATPAPPAAPGHGRALPSHAQATAALERAETLFHGTRREARAIQRTTDASIVLSDLRVAYRSLSKDQQVQADRLFARPSATSDGSGDPVYRTNAHYVCSTPDRICVHYVTAAEDPTNGVSAQDGPDANTTPDYVDMVLAIVVHVRSVYAAAGYRMPLDDSGSTNHGPNGWTDIYLANLGPSTYGYCTSDDPDMTDYAVSAYCVLDNNFSQAEFPTNTPMENVQVTAAHEFFHAVQFSYDIGEDDWIKEATATWAEDQLYTDVNDNLQYLRYSPISNPGLPMDVNNSHWYGTWIFFRYLTERVAPQMDANNALPVVMLNLWQHMDANKAANPAAQDMYSTQAISAVLASRGTSLSKVFSGFALAARHPTKFFREAAANHYPSAPVAVSTRVGPGKKVVKVHGTLKHLSYVAIRLSTIRGMASSWRPRLHFDLPNRARGAAATLWTNYRSGSHAMRLIKLDASGNATVSIKFGYQLVKNVEVELLNTSTRFSCWDQPNPNQLQYSCWSSHSYDDNTADSLVATAYKS
ncbi:MXAN_6640 family putative metalloprotease [Nocardioides montaniterrae]